MARRTYASVPTFFDQRAPIDFVGGYYDFVNRTVSNVVQQATPTVIQSAIDATTATLSQFVQSVSSPSGGGKGGGFSIGGVQLMFGQGLANIGGKYTVTNQAGRGGSTAAAKAILSSYNKAKSKKR